MLRKTSAILLWVVALMLGVSLAACGGDEHKDHKGYGQKSGDGK